MDFIRDDHENLESNVLSIAHFNLFLKQNKTKNWRKNENF